jgi:hypothetical protein
MTEDEKIVKRAKAYLADKKECPNCKGEGKGEGKIWTVKKQKEEQ